MSVLPIYIYDQPILKQKADPVSDMNDEVRKLIADMFETMHRGDGIGLAANQVGSPLAITVVDISDKDDERKKKKSSSETLVLVNPVIEFYSDEESEMEEGCLSLPGYRDYVTRPEAIQVRFLDEDMRERTLEADDLLARVIQHEVDHLNGKYFFERLSPLRRSLSQRKLRRIKNLEIDPDYPTFPSTLQRPTE